MEELGFNGDLQEIRKMFFLEKYFLKTKSAQRHKGPSEEPGNHQDLQLNYAPAAYPGTKIPKSIKR